MALQKMAASLSLLWILATVAVGWCIRKQHVQQMRHLPSQIAVGVDLSGPLPTVWPWTRKHVQVFSFLICKIRLIIIEPFQIADIQLFLTYKKTISYNSNWYPPSKDIMCIIVNIYAVPGLCRHLNGSYSVDNNTRSKLVPKEVFIWREGAVEWSQLCTHSPEPQG